MYLIAYKCIIFERKTNILVYIGCLWEEDPGLTEGIGWQGDFIVYPFVLMNFEQHSPKGEYNKYV